VNSGSVKVFDRSWSIRGIAAFYLIGGGVALADAPLTSLFEQGKPSIADLPWFTGPLLCPSAYVIPVGHINFEPYIFASFSDSFYDVSWKRRKLARSIWNITIEPSLWVGITSWCDINIIPTWYWNVSGNASEFLFGDSPVSLEFQLLMEQEDNYTPAMKLAFTQVFPLGKYDQLDPKKNGTDIAGGGAYVTGVNLTVSRRFRMSGYYWANFRLNLVYNVPTKTHVKGVSTYGGAANTDGIIYPPQNYQVDFAFELTLSRHWAFALDAVANYQTSTQFKGNPGISKETGEQGVFTTHSKAQYSLAPALEYNWNANLGLVAGAWFTFAGRSCASFTSYVAALNYYY
jgi:hypothetical protein